MDPCAAGSAGCECVLVRAERLQQEHQELLTELLTWTCVTNVQLNQGNRLKGHLMSRSEGSYVSLYPSLWDVVVSGEHLPPPVTTLTPGNYPKHCPCFSASARRKDLHD